MYLNFTLGTDEMARWDEICNTNAYQSRTIVQPDGEMVRTRLGEELPRESSTRTMSRRKWQETVLEPRTRVRMDSQKDTGDRLLRFQGGATGNFLNILNGTW